MEHPFPYWDQPLLYNTCGELYRTASDYIIISDLDEVIALEPSRYDDAPGAFLDWVHSWPDDVGGMNMIRLDLSMPEDKFREVVAAGGPSVDLLAQDTWTALRPTEELRKNCASRFEPIRRHSHRGRVDLRKSLFRAQSFVRVWTHCARSSCILF
jgi:hypothetical protein